MALRKLILENFKGKTVTFEFGQTNIIRGANGAGKTAIRDGIAFLFCGTDSFGVRNPTHLITKGEDAMKVIGHTDKAIISRTLSRKGNGTIKTERDGIASTYNQTQFEGVIGKPDTFLSAMIPGFLFDLSDAKRQEVLADVLPKIDRMALLTELLGFEVSAEEQLKYGFSRRPDLIASSIGVDRRSIQSGIDQRLGQIQQLKNTQVPTPPAVVDVQADIAALEDLKKLWNKYDDHVKNNTSLKAQQQKVKDENAYKARRRGEIEAELKNLILKPKPTTEQLDLESIRAKLKQEPSAPAYMKIVEADHCSNCGQAVSPRYRDDMRAKNDKLKEEFNKGLNEIVEHNKQVQTELKNAHDHNEKVKKDYHEVVEFNRKIEARRRALDIEAAALTEVALPEVLPEIEAPTEVYDIKRHMDLVSQQENYKREKSVYDHAVQVANGAQEKIATIEEEIKKHKVALGRLEKMEEVLKTLLEVETKKQIGVFNTDKILFDGSNVFVDGIPLKMLSTGERMKVHSYFSHEIMLRMPKPHGFMFQDDVDLISNSNWERIHNKAWDKAKFQDFLVYVTEDAEVTVEITEP